MSDISIPGVTSKIDTKKMIDDLMKVERVPLQRMEESVTTFEDRKKVWQSLSQKLSQFRDSANALYSFQNPFNQRTASSADESILTATATREAMEETKNITVKQTAKADRFLSKSLPKDFRVPSGSYGFSVGEKEIRFKYNGGKLSDFADTIRKKSDGLLKTQVVPNTTSTQVMLIEATKTGSENRLMFLNESENFGVEAGFLRNAGAGSRDLTITADTVQPWTAPLDRERISVTDNGTLSVKAGGEAAVPLRPVFRLPEEGKMVMELEVRVSSRAREDYAPPPPPPGPRIPVPGSVSLGGVNVEAAHSRANLPEWQPPPPPEFRENPQMLFLESGGKTVPLPPLSESEEFVKVTIPLSEYVKDLSSLNIRNENTHKDLEIRNVRISNAEARGEYTPVNPLAEASDAVILMDGIEVIRKTNEIDDLIPGVTLNLHREQKDPVEISVEPDREAVKEALIAFVGHYNQLLTEINILTRNDGSVIEEIEYFSDDEREKAEEKLGLFQGDITLMQMKTRMQSIMMNSYRLPGERSISLLSQIGISTDSRKPGSSSGVDATRLRGYLEIDEKKLDQSLESNLMEIKDLFGTDSDGDLIVDTGVAFSLENYVKPYVTVGGIIAMKQTTLDGQISRTNRDIENYNRHLERYEFDLKKKYGAMEGALNSMENSSKALENFSNNNSGR